MKTGVTRHDAAPGHAIRKAVYAAAGAIIPAAVLLETLAVSGAETSNLIKHSKISSGGAVVNVIAIDISDGSFELTSEGTASYKMREKFNNLVVKASATAAINGCFFDLKTGRLVGHVYTEGVRQAEGSFGAAFAVTYTNKPVIDKLENLGDTARYKLIVTCVDILIKDGKVLVSSKKDLVRNGHNPSRRNDIYKPARWTAIGLDKDGKVYFLSTNSRISMYKFVRIIKEKTKITDLLGLDGGISSAMYLDGKTLVSPAREITSIIAARPSSVKPAYIAAR